MVKVVHDSETPAQGQQVITACAFIWREFDGVVKVFLAKRADTKKFLPGVYELPGGHIDFDETVAAGLKREIAEELNMTVSLGDPFAAFTYRNEIKGAHAIEVIYFAKFIEPIDRVAINPNDHSHYDWFSREELIRRKKEIVPNLQAEYQAILRGFALLRGETLRFG